MSEPDTVNPSFKRISASPLMLIPPIPIKWIWIGSLKSILYIMLPLFFHLNGLKVTVSSAPFVKSRCIAELLQLKCTVIFKEKIVKNDWINMKI